MEHRKVGEWNEAKKGHRQEPDKAKPKRRSERLRMAQKQETERT